MKRSVEQARSRESLEYLKGETQEFLGISDAVGQIRRHIEILGENSSVNVLIRGETGTGKEVAARLIHDMSRRPGLMVRINCGAIPENLLENELFGYERGAFAGAMRTKKGLIEMADGGTVFFDEVGEMPLSMQSKLLTFLDDRKIKRVGGLEDIQVDVRISHKQKSGKGCGAGSVQAGSVLPAECHAACDSATQGEEGGHPGPLRLLSGLLQ